jgi:hypothetical protein
MSRLLLICIGYLRMVPRSHDPRRSADVGEDYPYKAKGQIMTLIGTLETLTNQDPEQEVQGIAVPVLDAVIESVRAVLPDDRVVAAVRSVLSPEQFASGEPIRAADALLVAKQLDAALGPYPLLTDTSSSPGWQDQQF